MSNRRLVLIALCLTIAVRSADADNWPQFRGPDRNAISNETGLARSWPDGGPEVLWAVEVCEGYASAAIFDGRVYFNDYDKAAKEWLVRCVSLADGKELWRFREKRRIRANHGITRTVPAVDGKYVFSMDPKCTFHCLDAQTGKELWRKNLVQEYHTVIPPWYTGQCPLIEPDRVIIAPAGDKLLIALDKATGKPIWETPNPNGWNMSHASVMPAELGGVKQYLYSTVEGTMGIRATDGELLWFAPWKFNVAVPTSPLAVGDGRVFLTSCYEAETVMIRIRRNDERFTTEQVFRLSPTEWNSEVHTPIVYNDHMFAVGKKRRGLFTCLDMKGKQVWTSRGLSSFGLGGYILADGMFYVLDGHTGTLRLLEANTTEYRELASAKVLDGHDVWAPLALSNGRLVIRDLTKMVCIDVSGHAPVDSTR